MKKQVWKAAGALLLSAVLALSASVSRLPAGMEAYAAQADENGFVIEDGVLTKYTGTAAEVVIPEGVTRIGDYAFWDCSSLTSITIPSSVTRIGDCAFGNCSGLTSIEIPTSVMSIGESAFGCCSSLTSIEIPSSVTSIESGAFGCCSSLTSIVVEKENTVYDSRGNCNAIIESSSNILIAGCKNTVIPEGVTRIKSGAFGGCSSLTSISIPSSVTSIGYSAFQDCSSLTSIGVEKGNTVYDSRGNCNAIIESSSNTL